MVVGRAASTLPLHADPLQHALQRRVFVDPVPLATVGTAKIAHDMFICDAIELLETRVSKDSRFGPQS